MNRTLKRTLVLLLLCAAFVAAQEQPKDVVAIVNGTVVTGTGEVFSPGMILIQGDRIAAVGAALHIPGFAKVIDARGMVVWPGMIDPYTTLGMSEVGMDRATNDANEATSTNTAQLRAIDGVNPDGEPILVTRIGGVTTAFVSPGGANPINGQGAIIDLSGRTAAAMTIRAEAALVLNFGAKRSGSYPSTRPGTVAFIRQTLFDAQAYAEKMKPAEGPEKNKNTGGISLQNEALTRALKGELPVFVLAGNAQEILSAIAVAQEFKLKAVLVNPRETWKVLPEIKAAGLPVLFGATFSVPPAGERYDRQYAAAGELRKAGIPFAFTTMSNHNVRNLPELAAMSVTFGLDEKAAVEALTLAPARILGIEKDYGSIAAGKVANIVIWSGNPLQLTSRVKTVLIRGVEVPLVSRQEQLRDKYADPGSVR